MPNNAPHLAWSANLPRRLKRIFSEKQAPDGTSLGRLGPHIERVDCWLTTSKLEASLLMYSVARQLFPGDYQAKLRLRLPWFISIANTDGYPQLTVTNRKARQQDGFWGPFASRDTADLYRNEVLRLYQVRRCSEPLHPSPGHSGCIYGEMNQCIRPCQCAVSRAEYGAEFQRVRDFLLSNGKTILSNLLLSRTAASEQMEYEQAAQLHKRIEQIKTAISVRDDYVSEMQDFHGLAVIKGRSAAEIRLWPMMKGVWQDPIAIETPPFKSGTATMDAAVKEHLSRALESASIDGDPFEHLSLFLRWYRSSWRDEAWLPFSSLQNFNYRRLVREISKLARQAEVDNNEGL